MDSLIEYNHLFNKYRELSEWLVRKIKEYVIAVVRRADANDEIDEIKVGITYMNYIIVDIYPVCDIDYDYLMNFFNTSRLDFCLKNNYSTKEHVTLFVDLK